MKFKIVYCELCKTTICVPTEFLFLTAFESGLSWYDKNGYTNSITIYSNIEDTCECRGTKGNWYRVESKGPDDKRWVEVEMELDDKFEIIEPRLERMDALLEMM